MPKLTHLAILLTFRRGEGGGPVGFKAPQVTQGFSMEDLSLNLALIASRRDVHMFLAFLANSIRKMIYDGTISSLLPPLVTSFCRQT